MPFRLTIESTSLGHHEELKAQIANPHAGEWVDLVLESRAPQGPDWERATFSGTIDPANFALHQRLLDSIIEESRPDIEVMAARMLVNGAETTRVRERLPYEIEVIVRANRLVPRTRAQLWALTAGTRLLTAVPAPLMRSLTRRGGRLGLHDSVRPKDYPALVVRA